MVQWKKSFPNSIETAVKDTHWFSIEIDGSDAPEVVRAKIFDFANVGSCLASGVEMVERGMATAKEVMEHCSQATKHRPLPRNVLEKYDFSYDGFLYCWTKHYFNKPLEEVKKEMESFASTLLKKPVKQ